MPLQVNCPGCVGAQAGADETAAATSPLPHSYSTPALPAQPLVLAYLRARGVRPAVRMTVVELARIGGQPMSKPRKRGRGVSRNGRSRFAGGFVMLPFFLIDSPAYRALKSGPRALLVELLRREMGKHNGCIGLGLREACKALNMTDRGAVARYFDVLEQAGFIACTKDAGFNMKSPLDRSAREWRLTWIEAPGLSPTSEFMRAKPDEQNQRVGKTDPPGSENPTVVPFKRRAGAS